MPAESIQHREFWMDEGRGGSLWVQSWGQDEELAGDVTGGVVIVHGLGDHSSRYSQVARGLANRGYVVMAHDQIGHGKTAGRRGHVGSFDWLLDDIGQVIESIRQRVGTAPVFLYGQSLGGTLVLNYALRHPEFIMGVIATSPLILPAVELPRWKVVMGQMLNTVWPSFAFANGLDPSGLSHDAAAVAAYQTDLLVHDRVSARLAVEMLEAGRWLLQHASELAVPALVLHGTGDPMTSCDASSEFARRAGDGCTLRTWPGLFHELHQEYEKEEVLAFVFQWMQNVTK